MSSVIRHFIFTTNIYKSLAQDYVSNFHIYTKNLRNICNALQFPQKYTRALSFKRNLRVTALGQICDLLILLNTCGTKFSFDYNYLPLDFNLTP